MRSKHLVLAAAVLLVAAAVYGAVRFFAPATDHAIALVPRDSVAYVNVFLKPSTDQRQALRDLLARFPSGGAPEQIEGTIQRVLDALLRDTPLSFKEDVQPWLGTEVGVFLRPLDPPGAEPHIGILMATTDEDAAAEAVAKARSAEGQATTEKTYAGTDYVHGGGVSSAVVDGFLAIGSEAAVRGVLDARDSEVSLDDESRYTDAVDLLVDDRIALLFVDTERLLGSRGAGLLPSVFSGALGTARGAFAAAVYARDDALVAETVAPVDTEGFAAGSAGLPSGGMLSRLPREAWAGGEISDLGGRLGRGIGGLAAAGGAFAAPAFVGALEDQTGLDLQDDLLSWMKTGALFIEGEPNGSPQGGLVVESSDPVTSTRTVNRIFGLLLGRFDAPARALTHRSGLAKAADAGFTLQDPGGRPLHVVAAIDLVSVVLGDDAARHAVAQDRRTIGDDPRFEAAVDSLGDGFDAQAFVLLPEGWRFVETLAEVPQGEEVAELSLNLDALSSLVIGSRIEDGIVTRRMVIQAR